LSVQIHFNPHKNNSASPYPIAGLWGRFAEGMERQGRGQEGREESDGRWEIKRGEEMRGKNIFTLFLLLRGGTCPFMC